MSALCQKRTLPIPLVDIRPTAIVDDVKSDLALRCSGPVVLEKSARVSDLACRIIVKPRRFDSCGIR